MKADRLEKRHMSTTVGDRRGQKLEKGRRGIHALVAQSGNTGATRYTGKVKKKGTATGKTIRRYQTKIHHKSSEYGYRGCLRIALKLLKHF